ncbi:MAG: hypothetical protein KAW84_00550 [Thermoplasmata archaeon]|nr:hypothetical protein [Thermoplasmata archaeon]
MNPTEVFKRWLRLYLDFLEEATKLELDLHVPLSKISNLGDPEIFLEVFGDAEVAELGSFMKMALAVLPYVKKLDAPFEIEATERLNLIKEIREKLPE